jgi:hypothetical protein
MRQYRVTGVLDEEEYRFIVRVSKLMGCSLSRAISVCIAWAMDNDQFRSLLDFLEKARPTFNPTMVRLLQSVSGRGISWLLHFQSHNGAIAAFLDLNVAKLEKLLSIPQWCDCCLRTAK